jgi:hypothetical protein
MMTNERIPIEHPRDADRPPAPAHDPADKHAPKTKEKSPWLREGADAPDAADIANPKRQR